MFNQDAAQRAARDMLAEAPRIEGGDGTELVISIKDLVNAIMAAGNPDALAIPAYDPELALAARYRLEQPTDANPGAYLVPIAHKGAVGITIRNGADEILTSGLIGPEFIWHLGLALCSVAQESQRRSEVQA